MYTQRDIFQVFNTLINMGVEDYARSMLLYVYHYRNN